MIVKKERERHRYNTNNLHYVTGCQLPLRHSDLLSIQSIRTYEVIPLRLARAPRVVYMRVNP